MHWLIRLRTLPLLALLSVAFAAAPSSAQDARLEAARKEGKVVWYTSLALTSAEKVARLFEAARPTSSSTSRAPGSWPSSSARPTSSTASRKARRRSGAAACA
jgi:hypothetical protein